MSTEKTLTVQPQSEPSVGLMLQESLLAIRQAEATPQSIEVLKGMMDLYERDAARRAEQAYAVAMHALQSDMPVIVAKTEIKNRGKYERFEDVMHVVTPLLRKHGFAVSFANDYDDNRVKETCKLSHIGGHSQTNSFTVRVGKNADSDTQADCKAATTAKRNALLNALNIVIRQDCLQSDDNVGNEGSGETLTQQQADELRDWVEQTGGDRDKFLKFAGAETFEEISVSALPKLHASLRAKAKANQS